MIFVIKLTNLNCFLSTKYRRTFRKRPPTMQRQSGRLLGGGRLEEVELSNTRTAYVMHIPNTLSLTSARNNHKQKFQ